MSCLTPFQRTDPKTGAIQKFPCGKCPPCMKRRISGWSFRLIREDRRSESAQFITLTYDAEHVPLTPKGFMTLRKRDVQLFFKRLRKAHEHVIGSGSSRIVCPHPIKYYVCGEYGGRTNRPHYHAIVYNVDINKIDPSWSLGAVHYGTVTGASIGYTLKYMSKPSRIPMHKNDDRLKEFSLMSKA